MCSHAVSACTVQIAPDQANQGSITMMVLNCAGAVGAELSGLQGRKERGSTCDDKQSPRCG